MKDKSDFIIIGGSNTNSREIAKEVAEDMSVSYEVLTIKKFHDGEKYVKVPSDVKNKKVIYIQSMASEDGGASYESIFELFLTVGALKSENAKEIILVVPYFSHSRQDKRFNVGEAISTNIIAEILETLGVNKLFAIDLHFCREIGEFGFYKKRKTRTEIKAYNMSASENLAKYVRDKLNIKSPTIVIPDEGHRPVVRLIRGILGNDVVLLDKKRESGWKAPTISDKNINLKGKDVVIFDDMVGTGRTMIQAVKIVKRNGANRIILATTHALFTKHNGKDPKKELEKDTYRIIATDTIKQEGISVVPVAPIISKTLKEQLNL